MVVTLCPLGWFKKPSGCYKVLPLSSPNASQEEVLHWDSTSVVCSIGLNTRSVISVFHQCLPVLQALFCFFLTSNRSAGKELCILLEGGYLKIYSQDGSEFDVVLPCKASRIWALSTGLLIERTVNQTENPPHQSPRYFTLQTPNDEPRPVAYITSNSSKSFLSDPSERILFCSVTLRFAVTYNCVRHRHTLWVMVSAFSHLQDGGAQLDSEDRMNSAGLPLALSPGFTLKRTTDEAPTPCFNNQRLYYGKKEIEKDDFIDSGLILKRIWRGAFATCAAASVFVADDIDGAHLICLFQRDKLRVKILRVKYVADQTQGYNETHVCPTDVSIPYSLSKSLAVSGVSTIFARAAQPIDGSFCVSNVKHRRRTVYIVVISQNYTIQLFRGRQLFLECSPPIFENLPPDLSASSQPKPPITDRGKPLVMDLRDGVSGRVSLELVDGRILRVCLPMVLSCAQSSLVRRCFDVLSTTLSPQVLFALNVDVASCFSNIQRVRLSDLNNTYSDPHLPSSSISNVRKMLNYIQQRVVISSNADDICGKDGDLSWVAFILQVCLQQLPPVCFDCLELRRVLSRIFFSFHRDELGMESFKTQPPLVYDTSHKRVVFSGKYSPKKGCITFWSEMLVHKNHEKYKQKYVHQMKCLNFLTVKKSADELRSNYAVGWWSELAYYPWLTECTNTTKMKLVSELPALLFGLHSLYEEFKLSVLLQPRLSRLASLLSGVSSAMYPKKGVSILTQYDHHYMRDLGNVIRLELPSLHPCFHFTYKIGPEPNDVLAWLKLLVENRYNEKIFSNYVSAVGCELLNKVCWCYHLLVDGIDSSTASVLQKTQCSVSKVLKGTDSHFFSAKSFTTWLTKNDFEVHSHAEYVVLGMVWCRLSAGDINNLPAGLSIPLIEMIHYCRKTITSSKKWPADAFVLIGRDDLGAFVLEYAHLKIRANIKDRKSTVGWIDTQELSTKVLALPPQHSDKRTSPKVGLCQVHSSIPVRQLAPFISTTSLPLSKQNHLPIKVLLTPDTMFPTFSNRLNELQQTHAQSGGFLGFQLQHLETFENTVYEKDNARLVCLVKDVISDIHRPICRQNNEYQFSLNRNHLDSVVLPRFERANDSDENGFANLLKGCANRFGRDRRLLEVCRLLCSSTTVRLSIERGPETTDHEIVNAQQQKLFLICQRTLALPIGRGMLTLSTLSPLLTKKIVAPHILLVGRLPNNKAHISLDFSNQTNRDKHMQWPSFHNGVATGLKAMPGQASLTRTWIRSLRPSKAVESSNTYAGVLLALGLQGHLSALTMADTYEYLAAGHDATTVAVLLGHSASSRGTMDSTVSKMLCLHIPSLLPPAFADLDVPAVVETAALIGIGLLYMASSHRLMTEFLLGEIGCRRSFGASSDRESYSLAAGLALGFVTLNCGARESSLLGLADLHIENHLCRYIINSSGNRSNSGSGAFCNFDAKSIYGCNRKNAVEEASCPSSSLYRSSINPRSGASENTNAFVAAPGAILALGLMYAKSGNGTVAARLALPDTIFLLDYVRPDLLMLRVLARGLILWDAVRPTSVWLQSQIPEMVQRQLFHLYGFLSDNQQSILTPPLRTMDIYTLRKSIYTRFRKSFSLKCAIPDDESITQAHAYIIGGACLVIGLRFVGTALLSARDTILKALAHLECIREVWCNTHQQRPTPHSIEEMLANCALSAALVMSGTGDLITLRVLRRLRKRTGSKKNKGFGYGQHMAIGMAIGMLFLCGGRSTLSDSNESIAALLAALYPVFPGSPDDNQYHLQALRHLYVLAVERRCLDSIDVARYPLSIFNK